MLQKSRSSGHRPPPEILGRITRRGEFITPDGLTFRAQFGREYLCRRARRKRVNVKIEIGGTIYSGPMFGEGNVTLLRRDAL